MTEPLRQKVVQRSFTDVAVGCVTQIVPKGDGFGQILVQAQRPRNGPCHLGNLQRVGQASAVVIALRREKNLGFEFKPAEGFAVNDPIPVPSQGISAFSRPALSAA